MSCTTILVGSEASYDGSTMIARTDDGMFDVKKLIVVEPEQQPRVYKSVLSGLEMELPENPLRYTACPSVDPSSGIWAASGINAANVGMTATETITTNPRIMGADPLLERQKENDGNKKGVSGGIGEEDMVVLVLPYIRSAREGVERLGALLEKYGTYECNGIAFNDAHEVWWLETVGGHHWLARRVGDNECIIMPNRFGLDRFDFADAFGARKENLCSADLREFVTENRLYLGADMDGCFNPRLAFGSASDFDHAYNTPRAWFMGRFLAPSSHGWDGPAAEFRPESNDIPWALVPDRKITVEDVAYLLSSHYQGTPFDPYAPYAPQRGRYRSIGINRTGVTTICQLRPYAPEPIRGVEWISFGSTTFSAFLPVYSNVAQMPEYLSVVTEKVSTENLYWASRLLDALADTQFGACITPVERYQECVAGKGHAIIGEYDRKMSETGDFALAEEANEKLSAMAREQTESCLGRVLRIVSEHMRNGYNRTDLPGK